MASKRLAWPGLLLLIALSGCVSRYPEPAGEFASSQKWGFTGKLGVRTETESANLGVRWDQTGDSFDIGLSGPLGLTVARIHGDAGYATLETGEGEFTADNPDELMAMAVGQEIPVAPMRYWVRGIPAPGIPFRRTADGLSQLGWRITWGDWQEDRPARITFSLPEATLRLIIRQWYW